MVERNCCAGAVKGVDGRVAGLGVGCGGGDDGEGWEVFGMPVEWNPARPRPEGRRGGGAGEERKRAVREWGTASVGGVTGELEKCVEGMLEAVRQGHGNGRRERVAAVGLSR